MKQRAPFQMSRALLAAVALAAGGAVGAHAGVAERIVVAQGGETAAMVSGQGEGVVKAVDAEERRIRIEHGPITGTLQMSGMAMAFRVAPGIDISAFAPGAKVKFTLTRDENRQFMIATIEAAK